MTIEFASYDWCVARVPVGQEFASAYTLAESGYVCFSPVRKYQKKRSRHSTVTVQVSAPALPGYVFVGFPAGQERHWDVAFSCRGIKGVLRAVSEEGPADLMVAHECVERFAHTIEEIRKKKVVFPLGATVIVLGGPLAGMRGEVVGVQGDEVQLIGDTASIKKFTAPASGVALAA